MPLADSLSVSSGHPYVYPKTVTTRCDTEKPYHFWLTAFLARDLVKNHKISARGAAAAAFSAQKGYEMLSSTVSRDPSKAFQVETFDPHNNLMRADMGFSSAGAVYGAQSAVGKVPSLDVDLGIKAMIEGAVSKPVLTDKESKELVRSMGLEFMMRWNAILSPNSAFELHQKKQ